MNPIPNSSSLPTLSVLHSDTPPPMPSPDCQTASPSNFAIPSFACTPTPLSSAVPSVFQLLPLRHEFSRLRLEEFIPSLLHRTISADAERKCAVIPFLDARGQERFQELLDQNNACEFEFYRETLQELIGRNVVQLPAGTAIGVTGSNGRGEQTGIFSPSDLVIIGNSKRLARPASLPNMPLSSPLRESTSAQSSPSSTSPATPPPLVASAGLAIPQQILRPVALHIASAREQMLEPQETNDLDLVSPLDTLAKKIHSVAKNELSPLASRTDQYIEIKDLGGTEPVSTDTTGERKVIPTIALDTKFILGDPAVYRELRQKCAEEFRTNVVTIGKFRKNFIKKAEALIDQQLTQDKEVSGVFVSRGRMTFDPNPITKEAKSRKGPKSGAVRTIQYSIAYKICQQYQKMSTADAAALNDALPNSITGRIDLLQRRGLVHLTPEELSKIKSIYVNLTFWYSVLQDKASRSDGEAVYIETDPDMLRQVLLDTRKICTKIMGKE